MAMYVVCDEICKIFIRVKLRMGHIKYDNSTGKTSVPLTPSFSIHLMGSSKATIHRPSPKFGSRETTVSDPGVGVTVGHLRRRSHWKLGG